MTVCLLLAAGSSSRMGQPKMLLEFNGKTLLQHLIDKINQLDNSSLLVVTGSHHSLLKDILQRQSISFVQNEQWEEGMGSSLQKGMLHVLRHNPHAESIIILVCDQPYISTSLLLQLIHTHQTSGKGIVASAYDDTMGTPVLFHKKYFTRLASLNGPQGAKKIIGQFDADTALVDFPLGAVDIDTPEDYFHLKEKN